MKRNFIFIEVMCALGLLVLLSVCFFASLNTIKRMDRAFSNDTRALQTVSNTVERLRFMKKFKNDEIKKVFIDEFQKGGFSKNCGITPMVKAKPDSSDIALLRANGKTIIEVNIKCRK